MSSVELGVPPVEISLMLGTIVVPSMEICVL